MVCRMRDVTVPQRVYETLVAGAVEASAAWLVRSVLDDPQHREVLHPGDPFGRIIAWCWQHNPDEAMMRMGDYLEHVRKWQPRAGEIQPPIRMSEILSGLRFAWPSTTGGYEEFAAAARDQVQGYYGANPEA
jgi:hypothetical protein